MYLWLYSFYSSLVGPTLCILTNDDAIATRIQMIFAWKFHYAQQHAMWLFVLFTFIHFCAGAQHVAYSNFVCSSIVSFCIFLSFFLDFVTITTWPQWVCVSAVRAVRFCWSHNTDWNLSAASQPAGGIVVLCLSRARLLFLSFFSPSPLSFLLFLEVGAAWGLLQDSQSTTKVVTAEIANKSHSCRSFISEHFPLGPVLGLLLVTTMGSKYCLRSFTEPVC